MNEMQQGFQNAGYHQMGYKSTEYALGCVSGMSRTLITHDQLERMAMADTVSDVVRLLAESGWTDGKDRKDCEKAAAAYVQDACKAVRELSPDEKLTICFLLKYDVLNLKLLLKSKSLGIDPPALSPCGNLQLSIVRQAVESGNYRELPEVIAQTLTRVDSENAMGFDPLRTEAALDKMMYDIIAALLPKGKSPERAYFETAADMTNLSIALRTHQMGREASFAEKLFVTGGTLTRKELIALTNDVENADRVLRTKPYAAPILAGINQYLAGGDLAAVEKKADDYLTSLLRPFKGALGSSLPLMGYLLAREREASAVRLVLTAKAGHVQKERLLERLRELYA